MPLYRNQYLSDGHLHLKVLWDSEKVSAGDTVMGGMYTLLIERTAQTNHCCRSLYHATSACILKSSLCFFLSE